jgi:hypothetical protein
MIYRFSFKQSSPRLTGGEKGGEMDQQYWLELLKENRELRQELERYKEALRLAIRDLHKLNHYCPAGIFYTCKDTTKTCFECLERYYLDKAKGG